MSYNFFSIIIISLGLINLLRLTITFISSDLYDLLQFKNQNGHRFSKQKKRFPKVDVLIAAYNEEKTIIRTLNSVYESTYPNLNITVINDGSKDDTANLVKEYKKLHNLKNLTLITQENKGKAHALNNALRRKKTSALIMTLDADSLIHSDAIMNAVQYFDDKKVVAVAANVRILETHGLLNAIQIIEYLVGYKQKKSYTVLNNEYIIGGIGATFRKTAIHSVSFYDTDTVTEDIDLTMKLLRYGNKDQKVMYGSNILCFTESVMTLHQLFKQRFRWKYGRFQTLWKNRSVIFSGDKRYSKSLTFLQLPFVLYSEFTFLFDPLFLGYILYLSFIFRDTRSYQGMLIFIGFFTFLTLITDEYLSWRKKIQYLFYAPLAYFFFLAISIVEYFALIKCIKNIQGIIYASVIQSCHWDHVERLG